ncbi:MAG: hypothetical protein B6I35_01380 [Anaerolineaceae bacterium 4572_32.2]|nr:MAG: hypothetical protein B6I35_01380 [Anaerolineaceae bacterium 4572_32.2]
MELLSLFTKHTHFTFLAKRYERRSVVTTSNLVFSEWDQIFKDPLTTVAAIDHLGGLGR